MTKVIIRKNWNVTEKISLAPVVRMTRINREVYRNFFYCVCVRVFVFFPFILDIKFVGRTTRGRTGRSHRISHPPSFCGACLYFSRERDPAVPFPRQPSSRILCTNDLIVLHPLGILFYFLKKNQNAPRPSEHPPIMGKKCQNV